MPRYMLDSGLDQLRSDSSFQRTVCPNRPPYTCPKLEPKLPSIYISYPDIEPVLC